MRSGRRKTDVEALVRAMVFNRLCAPDSKLGCLRWLDTVAMPHMPTKVTHQHLLRAMDALMDHADGVEERSARQIRPLVDRDLAVVFYDLTTVRIHGEGKVDDDIRAFGMKKETGGIARQFVLGVVQTAEGLPLMHTVHPGKCRSTDPIMPDNGMVERFSGRIEDVLQSHRFRSGEDLEQTILRHVRLYNGQLSKSVLKGRTPIDAHNDWQKQRPELFRKRLYNHAGCDGKDNLSIDAFNRQLRSECLNARCNCRSDQWRINGNFTSLADAQEKLET